MLETLMRWFAAVVCAVGTLAFMRASIWMNYLSWYGQGGDAETSALLGQVSISVDAFKCVLPFVIGWAWRRNHQIGMTISTIFFCACFAFSLYGALGLADASRKRMAGNHEAAQARHAAAEQELRGVEQQIASLGTARPHAVIEQFIEQTKQDRRWNGTTQCTIVGTESLRTYCKGIAVLRTELASSIAGDQLRTRESELQKEISSLLAGGVRGKLDGNAEFVAWLLGMPVESIQTSRSLMVVLVLEFGAAFGLFLAALPLVTRHRVQTEVIPPRRRIEPLPLKPTRFVRQGGRLLIK